MILLIDNFDSFTFNLYQAIGSINPDIMVVRNNAITLDEIKNLNPEALILSPGPGRPEQAGICIETVQQLGNSFPILGVCLGHQAIASAFGATISHAKTLMHGKVSTITIDTNSSLFKGLKPQIPVARYHSLIAKSDTLPDCLRTIATTDDGEIMAIEHTAYPIYGVQFHPESIMTPDGIAILENFLKTAHHFNTQKGAIK